jgi:hypothetical protein
MDTFHSAKIISLTANTNVTRTTLGNHKAVTFSGINSGAMGVTLDFVGNDGVLNSGHVRVAANGNLELPTRIYGLTADQAGSVILYN